MIAKVAVVSLVATKAEENNDEFRKGTVLQNIGSVYSNKKEFESSQEYYERALQICRDLEYEKGIATVAMNLSEVYVYFKSYDKALTLLNEGREIFERLNDPSLPEALNRISLLQLEKGQFGFTYCGIPVRYIRSGNASISISFSDGSSKSFQDRVLPEDISRKVFNRTGEISAIQVELD